MEEITIIYSKNDKAGKNLYEELKKIVEEKYEVKEKEEKFNEELNLKLEFKTKKYKIKVLETEERTIFLKEKSLDFKTNTIIFLNKHVAKSENNAITVHSIGNFNKNEYGGKEKTIVKTNPCLLTQLYLKLEEKKEELKTNIGEYTITFEATHHGPYSKNKIIYYELGASQKNWEDKKIAEKMIKILIEVLEEKTIERKKYFIIGGNHYVSNTYILTKKYCFYGSCPKYNIQYLDEKTIGFLKKEVDFIILDYDNMKEKEKIKKLLEENKIEYYKLKEIKRKIKKEIEEKQEVEEKKIKRKRKI